MHSPLNERERQPRIRSLKQREMPNILAGQAMKRIVEVSTHSKGSTDTLNLSRRWKLLVLSTT